MVEWLYPNLPRASGSRGGPACHGRVCEGGKGRSAAQTSIRRVAQGLRWREVQGPALCVGVSTAEDLARMRELGTTILAGLEAGIICMASRAVFDEVELGWPNG